ncbi:MAG TPA: hypothetical protein VLS93_14690 [Anaeromyxobacteraceae bacterium]|nr:hypothetical protein [Anaeromyxobacteraceae bacterium]
MRARGTAALLAAAIAALPATAAGRGAVELGARMALALPFGDAEPGAPLADAVSGQLPVWLEVSYRFAPRLALGAFGSVAPGLPGDGLSGACDRTGSPCRSLGLRAGLQATFELRPGARPAPWIGLGAGVEWLRSSAGSTTHVWSGWEWATVQGGASWPVGGVGALGPFLAAGLGRYGRRAIAEGGGSAAFGVSDPAVHAWAQVGVRGTLRF